MALTKEDIEKEGMPRFICDLQKWAVCGMFPLSKIQEYIDQGLFRNEQDWNSVTATAAKVLPYRLCLWEDALHGRQVETSEI